MSGLEREKLERKFLRAKKSLKEKMKVDRLLVKAEPQPTTTTKNRKTRKNKKRRLSPHLARAVRREHVNLLHPPRLLAVRDLLPHAVQASPEPQPYLAMEQRTQIMMWRQVTKKRNLMQREKGRKRRMKR